MSNMSNMSNVWLVVAAIAAIAVLAKPKKFVRFALPRARRDFNRDEFDVFPGTIARFQVTNSRGRPVDV